MHKRAESKKYGGQIIANLLMLASFGYVLVCACIEFYTIAWGSGVWLGEFSLKWGAGFFAFVLFCIFSWVGTAFFLIKRDVLTLLGKRIVLFREKLGAFRWLVVLILLAFPVWFLQYTPWGVVFSGFYFRVFLWLLIVLGLTTFLQTGEKLLQWPGLLAALLLTSSVFSMAAALINVYDYT